MAFPGTGRRGPSLTRADVGGGLACVGRGADRGPPLRVRLLEKPDCGLCAEVYRALRRVSLDIPLDIERVDITHHAATFDRYALRIPVLAMGERELEAAGVDDRTLASWLRA